MPNEVSTFIGQAVHIIFSDLPKPLSLDQAFFQRAHDALARELGVGKLFDAHRPDEICGRFLIEHYDLWNDAHGDPDHFVKLRLSLIELIFREAEQSARGAAAKVTRSGLLGRSGGSSEAVINTVRKAVDELNGRFQEAGIPLRYHNGIIQFAQDELSERQVIKPCWEILSDPIWATAEAEMKEALDRADSAPSDAAFHAAKALESVIKIISDKKGWTTGRERGAAAYIDNLVSHANGRLVDTWEAEALKHFFAKVRNPHGHGAGSSAPPQLERNQVTWAIEYCMIWIKSLVHRL